MKTLVLFVVLCTGVAMAAGLTSNGNKLPALLRSASAIESKAFRDKIAEVKEKSLQCIEDKLSAGVPGKPSELHAILIECYNNHKDNTECCKKAGFTDDKCAKTMCDGKPPVTRGEGELKCADDISEAVALGIAQCFLDSQ